MGQGQPDARHRGIQRWPGCFAAVAGAECLHLPTVVGALKPRDLPEFKWVNTVLSNLKTTLASAFHSLKCRKCADHYLAGRMLRLVTNIRRPY